MVPTAMIADWRIEAPNCGSASADQYESSVGVNRSDDCDESTSLWLLSEVRTIHTSGRP